MPLREDLIDLVIGDFGMTHVLTLTNRLTGVTIDLAGVLTAVMNLRLALSTEAVLSLPLVIMPPTDAGVLHLPWPEGATDDLTPGRYEGEIVLTGPDSVQRPYQLLQFLFRAPVETP